MKIEFNFELSDWLAFQKDYLENSKQMKRSKAIVTWLFPVMCVIIGFIENLRGELSFFGAAILLLFSIIWVLFYPKKFIQTTLKRSEKLLNEEANKGYLGLHRIELNETEIKHQAPESESVIQWVGIKKLSENDQYYFLYNTTLSALIIPKFKLNLSEAEMKELDDFIKIKTKQTELKTV